MKKVKILLGCLLLTAFGCKEVYKPDVISTPLSYLVVEGVLNTGAGPTTIRLSRTFKLDDTARLRGERNASVMVEGKDNSVRHLTMTADGVYSSPALNLSLGQEYRLKIKTSGGKEYQSDYMVAKLTPPIDSLGWIRNQEGLTIHVSTHDPSNNTRYYRWEYDETWEIQSYYDSEFKYVNGVVSSRTPAEKVRACWKYGHSTSIILGSSARLESDVITQAPIVSFLNGDEKLDVRYSILLRQYALDKRGYEFFELMKKNTESLGSIFDAQPSEMRGNIQCVSDPAEVVIGYINAVSVEEKRFFINRVEIPGWNFYEDCPEILVKNHPDSIADAYAGGGSIWSATFNLNNVVTYYKFSKIQCVECPARGGSLIRPSYW